MRQRDIDRGLSAAYPLSRAEIAEMPLDSAERELIAAIVAEPQEAQPPPTAPARRPRHAGRYAALFAAAAAAGALLLVVFGSGTGPAGAPAPAYGAELLRLAEISPHIVLAENGWKIVVAEESQAIEGFTIFQRGAFQPGGGPEPGPQRVAKFRWHSISVQKRSEEIASHGAVAVATAPVLGGTPAQVYTYPHAGKHVFEAVALWDQGGRAFEFRASVPNVAAFERRLADLERVGREAWLAAVAPLQEYVRGIEPICIGRNGKVVHPKPKWCVDAQDFSAAHGN
jgi:hypothetical protein